MIQFNSIKFDVINIQRHGEAEMQLNKRYMTFTKSLLEEMGWPQYVRPLVSAKDSVFALQACKATDENAYKFSLPRGEQKKAKYCCTASIKMSVIAAMGDKWNESKYYGFRGTYFPDDKAMVFELKDGYIRNIESFRRTRT